MIPIPPSLIAIGFELLKTALSDDEDENKKIVLEVIKKHSVPLWKQKKFIVCVFGLISAATSYYFGLPLEQILCAG